jgi:fatty-acyl-CoA synthase
MQTATVCGRHRRKDPAVNLADIGSHWARWSPHDVAVRFAGRSITWSDLDVRSSVVAEHLRSLGLGRGDRIAILMLNAPEWIEVTIAAWKLAAIVVPLNVRFTAAEVAFVVADSAASIIVTDSALANACAAVERQVTVLRADDLRKLVAVGHPPQRAAETVDDTPAFLCYTSGTTGDPKGAILTHGSWNVASQGWAQAIELTRADRVALPFPLAFTGGLAVFLFTYWAGARLVLEPSADTDRLLALFEDEGVTALLAVPVIYQQLADHPRFATADLSTWRIASSGGAPVPVPLIEKIQARGIPMFQGFSLTEVSAAATILPGHDATRKVGSAGLPVMHGTIGIVDDDGRPAPARVVGEITVGGPQIMRGYWNLPEESARTLANGVVHTGDLGYLDDEGYLFVVDRKKDMLISGGLNVYPAEIERALAGLPGLVEVAVIGVDDSRWGETPLVVAWTNGEVLSASSVLERCGELADYKRPRYLVVTDEPLPRNMSGKILKRDLRLRYRDAAATATALR